MSLIIEGGRRLCGDLTVQGAKNSVLPILAACILSGDVCVLQRCPRLEDVDTSVAILRHLGCAVRWVGPDLEVDASTLTRWDIPDRLMRRMRSSVVFLGAILARCGQAELSYPGGCAIGARPIDLHLSALRTLGACIREEGGSLNCTAPGLSGAEIILSLPSVGATENAMLAAIGASGTTTISNAAREPEIVDLQTFLRKLGANVRGAGTSTVVVEGAEQPLHGCRHRILGDRIAAATYGGGRRRRRRRVPPGHRLSPPVHRHRRPASGRVYPVLPGGRHPPGVRRMPAGRQSRSYRPLSGLPYRRPGGGHVRPAAQQRNHRIRGKHFREPLSPCAGAGAHGGRHPAGGPGGGGLRR